MKKKLFALLLTLCMTVSVAACGDAGDVRGTVESNSTESVSSEAEASKDEASQAEETEEALSFGTNQGGTYTSDFLKIGVSFPDWTFLSDEQILEQNKNTGAIFGDDVAAALENAAVIQDMMASAPNGSDSVNINIEKLTLPNIAISEKEYIELSIPQLTPVLEQAGFTVVSTEASEFDFAGSKHYGCKLHLSISGVNFYESLVVIKKGTHIACVTAAGLDADNVQSYLDAFYAVK